ncbi:Retrovirus-related Pol polyprotein from transposon TNT 1-94-like protein [Drosera capensis]
MLDKEGRSSRAQALQVRDMSTLFGWKAEPSFIPELSTFKEDRFVRVDSFRYAWTIEGKPERNSNTCASKMGPFDAYCKDELGYRLFDPVGQKLVRSRDVVLGKNQMIKDIEKLKMSEEKIEELIDSESMSPSTGYEQDQALEPVYVDAPNLDPIGNQEDIQESLAARPDLEVKQMDVKTVFLHGDLEEELYMEQHEGFLMKGKESYVYDFVILLLYMDHMLLVRQNTSRIVNLKHQLNKVFAMKDLGVVKNILGMQISKDRPSRKLWLSQEG